MYDCGLFTFTSDWKIKISKELNDKDNYLLIKTFELCYVKNLNKFPVDASKEYIEFTIITSSLKTN